MPIAFAFDYKGKRETGFIHYNALAKIALDQLSPVDVFDRDARRILLVAADKADRGERDDEGRIHIQSKDIEAIEFDPIAPTDELN